MQVGDVVTYDGPEFARICGNAFYYVYHIEPGDPEVWLIQISGSKPGRTLGLPVKDLKVVGQVSPTLTSSQFHFIARNREIPIELNELLAGWLLPPSLTGK